MTTIKIFTGTILIFLFTIASCRSNKVINEEAETKVVSIEEDQKIFVSAIEGLVLDGARNPIDGVVLRAAEVPGVFVETGIDGKFYLEIETPAKLLVSHPDYATREINIELGTRDLVVFLHLKGAGPGEEGMERSESSSAVLSSSDETSFATSSAMKTRSTPSRGDVVSRPGIQTQDPDPGQITAGEWNDLYHWEDWKELLANKDYRAMQDHWSFFPNKRYTLLVRNKYELPLQDVRVDLEDVGGKTIWTSRTDNSGKAELWAQVGEQQQTSMKVNARISLGGSSTLVENLREIESGVNHVEIDTECRGPKNVDVMFIVDATGSMGDEIAYLQSELNDVIQRTTASNNGVNLRIGSVFYRDTSDNFITKVQPLSEDHKKTLDFILEQSANGGGDYPEAVDAALEEALAQDWSEEAIARIAFLILDAPPHHNPLVLERIKYQIEDAAKEGIKLIPITASGINRQTEFLMKFMAMATNGTYVFITDHSGIGNPHLDPVVKEYEVEKLNDLIVRLLYHYTKSNGCTPNDNVTVQFEISPNPARHFVNLTSEKPIRSFKIYGSSGKLVMSNKVSSSDGPLKIDISDLVDGIYTIQCNGEELNAAQAFVVINS